MHMRSHMCRMLACAAWAAPMCTLMTVAIQSLRVQAIGERALLAARTIKRACCAYHKPHAAV